MGGAQQVVIAAIASLCLAPAAVSGQPWQGRFLLSANVAMSAATSTVADNFTYKHPYSANIPGEEASVETSYTNPTGALFDGGVLVRLYRNLATGVAYYQSSSTSDLNLTARIPHPFLIAHHRTVEGTTPARHEETGLHVNAAYVLPATAHVYVALVGGPTYFTVRQRLAKSVTVSETYPFDTAAFASAELEPVSGSGWGFNVGADVGWMFNRNVGIGGLLRYSKATLSLKPSLRDAIDTEVGGVHGGIGARVAF